MKRTLPNVTKDDMFEFSGSVASLTTVCIVGSRTDELNSDNGPITPGWHRGMSSSRGQFHDAAKIGKAML
jgi:hypothetical protein